MADRIHNYMSRWSLKKRFGTYASDSMAAYYEHLSDDITKVVDDFRGPTINSTEWTVGNGGGASAASPATDAGKANGAIKLVTGTAGDNTASSIIVSGRHFLGSNNAILKVRLNINTAVTAVKVEVGFKDNILTSAGNGAVVNNMATPTFIATDGVCWCYDTTNANGWRGLGVQNGTGATTDTGYSTAPVADTYEWLQIELVGTMAYFSRFDVDGKRTYVGTAMASAITAATLVAPYVYVQALGVGSRTVNVDFIKAYQPRTSTP